MEVLASDIETVSKLLEFLLRDDVELDLERGLAGFVAEN